MNVLRGFFVAQDGFNLELHVLSDLTIAVEECKAAYAVERGLLSLGNLGHDAFGLDATVNGYNDSQHNCRQQIGPHVPLADGRSDLGIKVEEVLESFLAKALKDDGKCHDSINGNR